MVVRKAIWEGVIPSPTDVIHLAAHFSRADLSTLRDFAKLKRRFSAVRRTYATTMKPLVLRIFTDEGPARVSVRLVDTMLIAPAGASLALLGETLGVPKVDLPHGYSKARMDVFKQQKPEEFERYALADAEIAARWAASVFSLARAEMGVSRSFPTLGSVGVAMIADEISRLGCDVNAFFGREKRLRAPPSPLPILVGELEFAAQCYHGGRNEAFALGFSPAGREVFDIDLCGAYTTAMALISVPNWSTARYTNSLSELTTIGALAFAHVRFSFLDETRIPSLPVRASSGRGLIYPLTGLSWCTGPELIVALNQGASIEVLQGLRIDFVPNSPRPFEEFARKISRIRKDAKSRGDQVLDSLAKEVGNSAYGKIAQAVAAQRSIPDDVDIRRVFDVETQTMCELGPSRISQPMLAAFITGAVRAMVCEALARIHTDHWIGSVTTDGFLSTAAVETIDQSGPIARSFSEARIRISPEDPKLWELKPYGWEGRGLKKIHFFGGLPAGNQLCFSATTTSGD
jgi:DNA polymerase type B, organellar and viral